MEHCQAQILVNLIPEQIQRLPGRLQYTFCYSSIHLVKVYCHSESIFGVLPCGANSSGRGIHVKNLPALAAVACAFLTGSAVLAADEPVRVSIDAARPGAAISRHIFGQFAEHLGRGVYEGVWVGPESTIPNTRGIRNDVVAALKAIKVPNIRWPGGCFADEYHWRNGIGPRDRRPATLNPNWGGVIEPNTFGTHEFMDFVQQVGADAYLSINVGSGTPAEAADWLEYLTTPQPSALGKQRAANGHPEPYAIPMLGIGNESLGLRRSMTPDYYVSQLKVYARYARNYNTNQKMQRIAVGPDSARHQLHQSGDGSLEEQGLGLGHRGNLTALLHGGEVAAGVQGDGIRRGRVRHAAE